MDWQLIGEDKLDNLPKRERNEDRSRDRYHGWNFPYRRMIRWLESKEGESPTTLTFQEKSSLGFVEGTVTFIESK